MNTMQFAAFGGVVAILTFLVSSGERVKDFLTSASNLWLERINLDDTLSAAVYQYCLTNMKIFGLRAKVFSGCILQMKGKSDEQMAAFDILKQSNLCFKKGWRMLVIKPGEWRYDPRIDMHVRTIDLLIPRVMWNSSAFIEECVKKYNDISIPKISSQKGRFAVRHFYGSNKASPTLVLDDTKRADQLVAGSREMLYEVSIGRAKLLGYKPDDVILEGLENGSPFDWYSFPSNVMDVVENARQWRRSRQWYKSKRIAWRRGWLVYGPPGSGKSLLAKSLAQDLDMPVCIFDLASMNNEEFESFWNQAGMQSPCMVLLEDFDAVFNGRENRTTGTSKLTFDCLLNCMSGIESGEGIFIVLTTNHLDHIDPSLGIPGRDGSLPSRPGRIDEVIHLTDMMESCRRTMAKRILGYHGEDLEAFAVKTAGMTAAQFTEACNRIALQMISKPVDPGGKNGQECRDVPVPVLKN